MRKIAYFLFLLLFGTSYSQQNFHPKEITHQGDNIIILSEKYNEFIKNYKPKQNQTLQKTTVKRS